jgi:glycine cleavage system H protein
MKPITGWLQEGLQYLGFILLGIVALLLLLTVAVAMRPLLIVGFLVAGLGCLVASYFSPAFREWFKTAGEWQINLKGLRLATDIAVYPTHSWARIGSDNVAVGADDLVQAALGPVEAVDLPPLGSHVEQGARLFGLRRGDRSVAVRAPISGTVVNRNESLLEHPELVNEGPFGEGWAVRLRADNVREDRRRLLQGKQAKRWFGQEIDRLIGTVHSGGIVMSTLPDGGVLVPDLHRQIDDTTWKKLSETFFDVESPVASAP